MLDVRASKAELRAAALARRDDMDRGERDEGSRTAVERLRPFLRPAETVSLFWPMRSEIDPRGLIDDVRAAGGRIAMPVIEKRRMFFRLFEGEESLEDGVFGTRHPHARQPVIDPDFIVAPLAAFDRRGGRIGYGAGYYDAAIANLRARSHQFRLAGIAFACQEVDDVPLEPHDVRLPLIATERELIRTGAPE
jgi:5-formyltetrahydrofolate cyclo-ligase